MNINSTATDQASLSEVLKDSESCPVVVLRKGRPVAVVVAVSNGDEADDVVYAFSKPFHKMLERSQRDIKAGKVLTLDELRKQLDAEYAEEDDRLAKKKPAPARRKKTSTQKNGVNKGTQ